MKEKYYLQEQNSKSKQSDNIAMVKNILIYIGDFQKYGNFIKWYYLFLWERENTGGETEGEADPTERGRSRPH